MRYHLALICLISATAYAGSAPTINDNSGSFTWSVPLEVPPGPGGSSPDLALVHSSAAGIGNAGYGWNLPYSSVSLDTRDGHPRFWLPKTDAEFCDPAVMGGRILLDGMELVPSPGDPWVAEVGANLGEGCVFRTRPDTFLLAVPLFDDSCVGDSFAGPTGWAVVRQNGMVWWYGDSNCQERDWQVRSTLRYGPQSNGEIDNRWLLHHVEDREGNLVTWWPDRRTSAWPEADSADAGCDGCARYISWAEAAKEGNNSTGRAFDPVLQAGTSEWSYPPIREGGAASDFRGLLERPGDFFPATRMHRLFAQLDWEERPDTRTSWRTGAETLIDRRLKQVSVGAWGHPERAPDGRVQLVDDGALTRIRTYRLDHLQGSTGRSLLTRVWTLPGEYDESTEYAHLGIPTPGDPWIPADRAQFVDAGFAPVLPNPWEFVYSSNDLLDPALAESERQLPEVDVLADPMPVASDETNQWARKAWMGSSWAEGGFPTRSLMDLNADGLPDLVQHDEGLPAYSNVLDNLSQLANPWLDLMPEVRCDGECEDLGEASSRFWVHWNQGGEFSTIRPGPYDPLAAQEVVEFMPLGLNELLSSYEIDVGFGQIDLDSATRALLDSEFPSDEPGAQEERREWEDELRERQRANACARRQFFDEQGFDPLHPWETPEEPPRYPEDESGIACSGLELQQLDEDGVALSLLPFAEDLSDLDGDGEPESIGEILDWIGGGGDSCEVWWSGLPNYFTFPPGTSPLHAGWCEHRSCAPYCERGTTVTLNAHRKMNAADPNLTAPPEAWIALEQREAASASHPSGGQLVLWERYGRVRGTSGDAAATAGSAHGLDFILGGIEPRTRVRWVDGYARQSLRSRIFSEHVERQRVKPGVSMDEPDVNAPGPKLPPTERTVLEGTVQGTFDINGDGYPDRVLSGAGVLSDPWGRQFVWNTDPGGLKDFVVSTAHMPFYVSLFDPEAQAFGELDAWELPLEHPWLMGSNGQPTN